MEPQLIEKLKTIRDNRVPKKGWHTFGSDKWLNRLMEIGAVRVVSGTPVYFAVDLTEYGEKLLAENS